MPWWTRTRKGRWFTKWWAWRWWKAWAAWGRNRRTSTARWLWYATWIAAWGAWWKATARWAASARAAWTTAWWTWWRGTGTARAWTGATRFWATYATAYWATYADTGAATTWWRARGRAASTAWCHTNAFIFQRNFITLIREEVTTGYSSLITQYFCLTIPLNFL